MAALERRVAALRLTMGEACELAHVAHSTWSRAKARGRISVPTIRKVEDALDRLEAAQAARPAVAVA